jgi:hypothetical protein
MELTPVVLRFGLGVPDGYAEALKGINYVKLVTDDVQDGMPRRLLVYFATVREAAEFHKIAATRVPGTASVT